MMSSDSELGKKMIGEMVMEAVIPSLQTISGRTFSDEWEGGAEYVEGSPDFIVGLDGKPFGIEITEIRRAGDAWDYVDEAFRLAHKKNASYTRRPKD